MKRPPLWAFQNWLPRRTAAEQLRSVPRFFGDGQIASVAIIATKAASTGRRNTASLKGSAQKPSSDTSLGKIQPNICRNCPRKTAALGDVNQSATTSRPSAVAMPSRKRRMPRSQ